MDDFKLYIRYNHDKLNSIGYTNESICELVANFFNYIEAIEYDFKQDAQCFCNKTEALQLLHKLEGALQYLALSGPIEFIQEVRVLIQNNPDFDSEKSFISLFIVINKTLETINEKYRD